MIAEIITSEESRDLVRLEAIVAKGIQTFVEVGEALAEIRDRRLYRIEHAQFDDYLQTKWQISRSHAWRLIEAAETVKMLPAGNKPTTERQARALTRLPREERAAAWSAAVSASPAGTPTAKEIEAVVIERCTGEPPTPSKTPLQWLTYWWQLASEEDRQLFDNFRTGMGGL